VPATATEFDCHGRSLQVLSLLLFRNQPKEHREGPGVRQVRIFAFPST
jgi:hypothetical protein